VINIKTTARNGKVVGTFPVGPGAELIIITGKGKIIRMAADTIRMTGRNALGVKLMDLGDGDTVADVSLVAAGGDLESESSS
jgi:DNA gyrase subunit A